MLKRKQLPPRDRRLNSELEYMKKLQRDSSFVQFEVNRKDLPEEYVVTFTCLGLVAEPAWNSQDLDPRWRHETPPNWIGERHIVHIYLPIQFPIAPPQLRFKTPIYHPNIRNLADGVKDLDKLAERVGGYQKLQKAFQDNPEMQRMAQNLFSAFICLDGIKAPEAGGNYSHRLTLYDICHELGQMIMYQRYNIADPLNHDAAQWAAKAEKQENILPIDNRPFLDKLPPVIHVLKQEEDLGIEILSQ